MEENLQEYKYDRKNRYSPWLRELFVLFYIGILGSQILRGYFTSNMMSMLLTGVDRLCAAGMIFASGCLMGSMDANHPDFQKHTLRYARNSYLAFFLIGIISEMIVYKQTFFWSVRYLLSVTAMPHHSAIFFTLTMLFLLCAFLWQYIEVILRKPLLLLLVSVLGFLCTLIPEELVGYALTGAFIGSDIYHCVALFPHLFFFFLGVHFIRRKTKKKEEEKLAVTLYIGYLIIAGICGALGVGFFFLGLKESAWVMFGGAGAIGCVWVSGIILPIYKGCEFLVKKLADACISLAEVVSKQRQKHHGFDLFMYYIGYTILFVIFAYLVFEPFITNGKTIIWSTDSLGQYLPKVYRFLDYIPDVLRDILHGNTDFRQYDFHTGLGGTISLTYDPVYWLYLFIKPEQIEGAYSAMILFRYYLTGLSMSACLLYFKKSKSAAYVGSMVYVFSGYALYAGTRHGQFITPLFLLPVLVIAMEKIIREKKWYLMTVMMALSLLCSYYFLYMNVIALGIYFILRVACDKEYRSIKIFINRSLIIIFSSLLGFAMGSISLVTSFGNYVGSSRSSGDSVASFLSRTQLFYRTRWIMDYFMTFLSTNYSSGLWLRIGLPPLVLLSAILLFTRKNRNELRWMFVIFTTFIMFPIFGYMMNGFSSVSNRWGYIYIVVLVFILIENISHFDELKPREIKLILMLTALYFGNVFFARTYRNISPLAVFGLLAATVIVLLMINYGEFKLSKKRTTNLLYAITLLTVLINANFFTNNDTYLDQYVDQGTSLEEMSKTAFRFFDEFKEEMEIDDETEPFYRSTDLYTYGDSRSTSMIYGYNDIATFNSTLNSGIVDYNAQMGNMDWNLVTIQGYNLRTYMYELASVRFLGSMNTIHMPLPYGYEEVFEKKLNGKTYKFYENQYALPLGYTYDTITSDSDSQTLSAIEKQELTMLSAVVEDDVAAESENTVSVTEVPLTAKRLDGLTITAKSGALIWNEDLQAAAKEDVSGALTATIADNVSIVNNEKSITEELTREAEAEATANVNDDIIVEKNQIIIGEEGGTIEFDFVSEPNSETYLFLKGDMTAKKDASDHFLEVYTGSSRMSKRYRFRIDTYATGQEDRVFSLGYHGKEIHHVVWTFETAGTISFDDIAIYSQSMDTYEERVNARKESTLENAHADKNTVTGTITADKDKTLVISLPYQSGWTAYVDGEEVPLFRANYQYMGLNITKGTHDIRLHYRIPGLKIVFILTVGGFVLFLGIILAGFILKRRKKTKERDLREQEEIS